MDQESARRRNEGKKCKTENNTRTIVEGSGNFGDNEGTEAIYIKSINIVFLQCYLKSNNNNIFIIITIY